MLDIQFLRDEKTKKQFIETSLSGKLVLNTPLLNKGTAFSLEERKALGLLGKLPIKVETLAQQVDRAYAQYCRYTSELSRNIYLYNLHERNEVLFYRLVTTYLEEMMPIIYTPIVGSAVKQYSREFRQPRGLYINYPDRENIEAILANRTHPDIDLIVVSDGSGVLGLGDQGVGAMDIPIAKLMVYTLCGGINPAKTLPIMLDVGTDNQALLDDPFYLGWQHERIAGDEYDKFIHQFVSAIQKHFPNAILHWEDFAKEQAHRNLKTYRDKHCSFNDDVQGTGAVVMSALMSGIKAMNGVLSDQRIVIVGAGAAGIGIANEIHMALEREGLSEKEARKRLYLLDSAGLLTTQSPRLNIYQAPYARAAEEVADWSRNVTHRLGLLEVMDHVKPTVLIGCSSVSGLFTEPAIRQMAKHVERPIILPLSNPTECAEAHPEELYRWTEGRALVATGSPFGHITYHGKMITIAQCNNALVFPGISLGALAIRASKITDNMIWAAVITLAELSPILRDKTAPLLPSFTEARNISIHVAQAVAEQAYKDGVARADNTESVLSRIENLLWSPEYLPIKYRTKS